MGSRTQWNVTKEFYMGLDVMYAKIHSATDRTFATGAETFQNFLVDDVDNIQVRFRVHRDFYP